MLSLPWARCVYGELLDDQGIDSVRVRQRAYAATTVSFRNVSVIGRKNRMSG